MCLKIIIAKKPRFRSASIAGLAAQPHCYYPSKDSRVGIAYWLSVIAAEVIHVGTGYRLLDGIEDCLHKEKYQEVV
jgi:hypothetical protein